MPSASRFIAPPRKTRRGRAQSEMAHDSLTQVTGSFLESSTAKMDAPAVCTQRTHLGDDDDDDDDGRRHER